jgi:leucyl-tRNA synthetase
MVNQGMIQGQSKFITAIAVEGDETSKEIYLSADINLKGLSNTEIIEFLKQHAINLSSDAICRVYSIHVPIACVDGDKVSVEKLLADYSFKYNVSGKAQFIPNEGGLFIARTEVEKMSKSKYNVVNPDDVIEQYGADCFRMYEMFLGPIEVSKPWDTKGIEGVSRFLRKLWNLFYDAQDNFCIDNTAPSDAEWKVLHKTIKKIEEDIQRLSFNTAVAQFMIAVNELGSLKCNKRAILEPLIILLNPFAPFITEELWKNLGNTGSIVDAAFPLLEEKYLVENSFSYPVAINGKTRINLEFALDADPKEVESIVLAEEQVQKYLNGAAVKKFIFVKGRMINIVI